MREQFDTYITLRYLLKLLLGLLIKEHKLYDKIVKYISYEENREIFEIYASELDEDYNLLNECESIQPKILNSFADKKQAEIAEELVELIKQSLTEQKKMAKKIRDINDSHDLIKAIFSRMFSVDYLINRVNITLAQVEFKIDTAELGKKQIECLSSLIKVKT
ncbi:MAG: hypothetical protein KGZ79_08950 [Dethiobacter sp.]|jgi:predicted patatin/cPLA2 family phospholipase|nr:hypothetical protein [Dethiobacter sp.]